MEILREQVEVVIVHGVNHLKMLVSRVMLNVKNAATGTHFGPIIISTQEFVKELRHNERGLLSMANSGPNTNRSQL